MEARFQRTVEDFKCEVCQTQVRGNGYTDHCPKCLWSKHVDVNPGDRASDCKALMRPVSVEFGKRNRITYECTGCGQNHSVKAVPEDDFDTMLNIARQWAGQL